MVKVVGGEDTNSDFVILAECRFGRDEESSASGVTVKTGLRI